MSFIRTLTMPLIRPLSAAELPRYRDHLLRLDAEDRRLRFGFLATDDSIRQHVAKLDLDRDRILVGVDANMDVIAAAHVSPADAEVEFAFSVDRAWRGRGLGTHLFDQAVLWARNRGLRQAHLYCLADNQVMKHMARKSEMVITSDAGESEGCLTLLPPTPLSLIGEMVTGFAGLFDLSLKSNLRYWKPSALLAATRPASSWLAFGNPEFFVGRWVGIAESVCRGSKPGRTMLAAPTA